MQRKSVLITIILAVIIISLACQLSAPTPVSWQGTPTALALAKTQTSAAGTESARMTEMPAPLPTLTPTTHTAQITPKPTQPNDGPWLLYPGRDGVSLFAFDLDTGALTQVSVPSLVNLDDLADGLSPSGEQLMLRAGRVEELNELGLYLIENPLEEAKQVSTLLSIFLQRDIITSGTQTNNQVLLAVQERNGINWTRNGSFVAFTAAKDGDSCDIYLYDPMKEISERMTVRYRESLTPFWSPDNAWLVFQEAVRVNQQGDWVVTAVSDVSMPDYDRTKLLYVPPTGSTGDVMVGWLNSFIFLSYSLDSNGPYNLRQVNLDTQKAVVVFPKHFTSIAFDPDGKVVAMLLNKADAFQSGMEPGVFLSTSGGSPFSQILKGEFDSLEWSFESGMFITANMLGISGFNASGVQFTLANESRMVMSQGKTWLIAWNDGPGVRLYTAQGNLLQNVSDIPVLDAFWQPDSKCFYLVNQEGLYQVKFPLLQPVLINADVYQSSYLPRTWLPGE